MSEMVMSEPAKRAAVAVLRALSDDFLNERELPWDVALPAGRALTAFEEPELMGATPEEAEPFAIAFWLETLTALTRL